MIEKPYYRIYRPFYENNLTPEYYDYINDSKNCREKSELVRYYRMLENEVKAILNYIEPSENNLKAYSLKIYQILTNICIEVENNFKGILKQNGNNNERVTMKDYCKLNKVLKLNQYEIQIIGYKEEIGFRPFKNWDGDNELEWYKAYNSVKHNRTEELQEANLENLLKSLGALAILLYSQFGMYSNCIAVNNLMVIQVFSENEDSGIMVQNNQETLIEITRKPNWDDDEKYNFEWDKLKLEKEPFEKLTNIISDEVNQNA